MITDEIDIYNIILTESGRWRAYKYYLASAHWFLTREWILERDAHTCQWCHTTKRPLHIHHKTYVHLWAEVDADLITLCAKCHKKLHRTQRKLKRRRK